MDFTSILPTLAAVAPAIATALGGPLAGMGVRALESVFGVTGSDAVQKAVLNMDPETAAKVRAADQEFAVKMKSLDIDLVKIAEADRESAREMQIQTKDWTPRALAMLITFGFFGLLGWMLVHGLDKSIAGSDAFLVMLGSLGTAWTTIVAFYYGSSAGSEAKNAILDKMTSRRAK